MKQCKTGQPEKRGSGVCADVCQAIVGARLNLVQKAAQLLAHMHQPHQAPSAAAADAWHAAGSCLGDLTEQVKASKEGGDGWAAEVLRDVEAAAKLLPGDPVRDEL